MVNGVGFGFEAEDGEPSFSFWGWAGLGNDGPLETVVAFFGGNQVVGANGSMPKRKRIRANPVPVRVCVWDYVFASAVRVLMVPCGCLPACGVCVCVCVGVVHQRALAREIMATPERVDPHKTMLPQRLNFRQRYYWKLDLDRDGHEHSFRRRTGKKGSLPPSLPRASMPRAPTSSQAPSVVAGSGVDPHATAVAGSGTADGSHAGAGAGVGAGAGRGAGAGAGVSASAGASSVRAGVGSDVASTAGAASPATSLQDAEGADGMHSSSS